MSDPFVERRAAELRRNPDPISGEPRPIPVGECPVCHTLVFDKDEPVPVVMIDGRNPTPWSKPDVRYIHGAIDCTDLPKCDEKRSGMLPGTGEWSVRCELLDDHDGDHYWSEP